MLNQDNINDPQIVSQSSGIDSILNTPIPKIKVIVRKRPLNTKEINKKETDIISIKNNSRVIVSEQKVGLDLTKYIDRKEFIFDNAYDESSNNELIYIQNIRPMIFSSFYFKSKITCFAYGQTGSGKTFTMMGSSQWGNNRNNSPNSGNSNLGMYMMAGYDIFQILENESKFNGFKILVSFYEIYCDKLFDLLNNKNKLETREDKKHNINIVGLSENLVNSLNELMSLINYGLKQRTVGKTGANSDSSRSHGIIQIRIINTNNNKEHGKITFIDLAGSEREVDKVNINKKTRIDGAEINKSLLALKECIRALDQEKSHTPFRGSKLTLVLRDSFIGDCKILMIANISPGNNSSDHTLNTLRYADRVKELKKNMNSNKNNNNNNNNNNIKYTQSQTIGNLLNNKNNNAENTNENLLNTSFTKTKNGSKYNFYKGADKKRRNSSTSSSSSFNNKLNKNKNNYLGNNKINFNTINNYMPFTSNQKINNTNSPHNLFSSSNFSNFYVPMNNNIYNNNIDNNNTNNNYIQNDMTNESKKINNLFINNNNTNINSYSLSFNKKETNLNDNFLTINNNTQDINLNQSFHSSSNSYSGLSLIELQNKKENIIKSLVYQESICKENQQRHINALCESLKTEMLTFQQYQKQELQINTYIDSMQNLFKNQINQITEMNNQLEKLKNMINKQAHITKLIDKIKSGQNNIANNLFDAQLNNLEY